MPSTQQDSNERRNDQRHILPGLRVQVGKRSFANKKKLHDVELIDFSENGLAFSSSEIHFKELDKVDVQLSIKDRHVNAQALICYQKPLAQGNQFGLLFVNTSQDMSTLLGSDAIYAMEAQAHAEQIAERVAQLVGHSDQNVVITRQWKLLLKAVEAFISRIREIARQNANTKAELKAAIGPINEFLQINSETRSIAFTGIADDDQLQSTIISVGLDAETKEPLYRVGDHWQSSSVYDVIDLLGQAFVAVHQHKS